MLISSKTDAKVTAIYANRVDSVQFRDLPKQHGVTLDVLRELIGGAQFSVSLTVVAIGDAYGVRYSAHGGRSGWLVSDHTRDIRGFAKADTAIKIFRQLGLKRVVFDLAFKMDSTEEAA